MALKSNMQVKVKVGDRKAWHRLAKARHTTLSALIRDLLYAQLDIERAKHQNDPPPTATAPVTP